jgi:hypothetical protein
VIWRNDTRVTGFFHTPPVGVMNRLFWRLHQIDPARPWTEEVAVGGPSASAQ